VTTVWPTIRYPVVVHVHIIAAECSKQYGPNRRWKGGVHQSEGRSSLLTFGITAPSIEVGWPQQSAGLDVCLPKHTNVM
jgi:hypothetical protein